VSANLDLVRSIYADWERGDFSRSDWAHPEINFVLADGPEPGSWTGVTAMGRAWAGRLSAFDDYRTAAYDYREIDDARILASVRHRGRGRSSGIDVADVGHPAALFHIHDGRVTRLVVYIDPAGALADLGLEE
jgi:ketosteroid isomerase-like protein